MAIGWENIRHAILSAAHNWRDGQITEAYVCFEQAVAAARILNDTERQIRSLNMGAYMLGTLRDHRASLAGFDQALALCTDDRYELDRILVYQQQSAVADKSGSRKFRSGRG
ncbi:MAG: hypothetical protein WDN69_28775 [Aliidongia sp.]